MATGNQNQDTRLRKDAAADTRAPRSSADAERNTDSSGLTREQRAAMLRSEFTQEALPGVPAAPGWHFCWLAANNAWDPLHKRIRLGYQPVTVEEVPELASFRMGTGEYTGVVACNEMLLFKIPTDIYDQIMREFHHDAPLREEEALRAQLKRQEVDSTGRELGDVEGFEDLGQRRRAPSFA